MTATFTKPQAHRTFWDKRTGGWNVLTRTPEWNSTFVLAQKDDSGASSIGTPDSHRNGVPLLSLSTVQFLMPMGFIPESKLQPVPESKFVVDRSQVIFDDVFGSPHQNCHLAIVESLRDEFDHLLLSLTGQK